MVEEMACNEVGEKVVAGAEVEQEGTAGSEGEEETACNKAEVEALVSGTACTSSRGDGKAARSSA